MICCGIIRATPLMLGVSVPRWGWLGLAQEGQGTLKSADNFSDY